MEIFRFENPQYLLFFALVPVLLGLFWLSWHHRKRALKRFGDPEVIGSLMPSRSVRRPWFRFILLLCGLSMLILTIANPLIGSRMQEAKREGIDVMIVLDVSYSMLAEDISPNRLERAKMAVSRLIDRLGNDRVGLVVFAGNAITKVPITIDHSVVKMILRTVNTNTVATQGTAIGSAIERALVSFSGENLENKVIIIISDGENHLDDPVQQAILASEQGVVIHTVGIGTRAGAPIPVYQGQRFSGFLRDNAGNTVVSRYDEITLRKIADATKGKFMHGTGVDMGLNSILDEIKKVEKDTYETMVFADYQSRYHYFLSIAIFFLLLEIFIFEKKNKWLQKIKLFGQ